MEVDEQEAKRPGKPGLWRKRKINRSLYTGDDASVLLKKEVDDTDQVYAYNVTNFKVSALIAEVTYSSSQAAAIRSAFTDLKNLLMSASGVKANALKVKIPSPNHPQKEKILSKTSFVPVVDVHLCGSFVTGLCLSSATTVDVRLMIPKSFYKQKDYLNQKWLVRKGYYVAVLAHHLLSTHSYTINYYCPHDNPLDVALCVVRKDAVTFNILLHTEEPVFLNKRLSPLASNVRAEHVGLPQESPDTDVLTPTQLYNNTLATNQISGAGEQLTADWINESDVIKQCMMLTRIWMHQRQLDTGFQCVTPFIVRMLMIYLLKNGKLAYHTTGHQMFLTFLQKIVSFDWSKPICLKDVIAPEVLANHKKVSEYVFIDPTGKVNYCAAVSKEAMDQLTHHAEKSMLLMRKDSDGSFEDMFIRKLPAHLYYDYSVKLTSVSGWTCTDRDRYIDSCGDTVYSALPKVLDVVRTGLGNRITNLAISPICRILKSVHRDGWCSALRTNDIILRFHINPDLAHNNLERGPPADDPLAEQFRQFWGEQANLRRFMDGAICEAVVWKVERTCVKRNIIKYILKHVLKRHCKMDDKQVVQGYRHIEQYLSDDNYSLQQNCGTGEEEAAKCQAVLFKLTKQLRAIQGLPLDVTDVMGLDAASRDTRVFVRIPNVTSTAPPIFSPLKVMCVVEGSKWPDKEDLAAIETLKMLMLLKMNEGLNSLESVTSFVREGGLTIFQDGLQFDVTIMNAAELARLRHNHDSLLLRQQFRDCVVLPHITRNLSGLQSQHSVYATTARFLKRWAGIHLLSTFLPEPCTDLIAGSLFVHPKVYQVPRCPVIGFLRCLDLIVHFDWVNEPLILNFNEEINDDRLGELMEEFKGQRSHFPCMSMVTPADSHSIVSKPVMPFMLKLVIDVASKCLRAAEEPLANLSLRSVAAQIQMFRLDGSLFDILIELLPQQSRQHIVVLEQQKKAVSLFTDPADAYIKHIQEAYGDKAVVMYDSNCIRYIGLIWKPGAHNAIPLKMACVESITGASTVSHIDNELSVSFDTSAMVQELNMVGKDIVASITVNSVPECG